MTKPKPIWVDGKPFFHWRYEKQTEMKHKVVTEYFRVWATKVGRYNTVAYFDCFGGCGAYIDDNNETKYGSPFLMAMEADKLRVNLNRDISIYVTEPNEENYHNLLKVIDYLKDSISVLPKIKDISFEQLMQYKWTKDQYRDNHISTLFLLDPFGYSLRFSDIEDIMNYPKNEMIITFMFDYISRFIGKDDGALDKTYTDFFGTDEWKEAVLLNGEERENKLVEIYTRQLKRNAKYVFPYKLYFPDKNRTYYYLFHVTNHIDGCSIMKSAFASKNYGRVEYLGRNENVLTVYDMTEMKLSDIKSLMIEKYRGQEKCFNSIIDENIDTTPYLEKDIRAAIKEMEKESEVIITRITSKASGKGLTGDDKVLFTNEVQTALF